MPKSHKIWNKNHPNDKVKKGEVIHHKDGNHNNDTPENQEKMTKPKHTALHRIGKKHTDETKIIIGKKSKERRASKETKSKMSKVKIGNQNALGYKHTNKAKLIIGKASKGREVTEETKRKMSISHTGYKHSNEAREKMKISWRKRKKKCA